MHDAFEKCGRIGGGNWHSFAVKAPLKFIPVLGQTANVRWRSRIRFPWERPAAGILEEIRQRHVPLAEE